MSGPLTRRPTKLSTSNASAPSLPCSLSKASSESNDEQQRPRQPVPVFFAPFLGLLGIFFGRKTLFTSDSSTCDLYITKWTTFSIS